MEIKNKPLHNYILLAGVILTTASGSLSAIKNHLVADSWVFVYPRSFSETLSYFHTSIIPEEWDAFWLRPVPMIFFWLDNIIWPGTEWGPHLTNILFHLCNVWLIWLIIAYMCGQSNNTKPDLKCGLPVLASCLFYGLHPLNVGSVGWVAARFDVMSVTFGLAGVLLWLKWSKGSKKTSNLIYAALLLMCAILSKEQGVVFLAVCFLTGLIGALSDKNDREKYWYGLAFLAFLVICYLMYRYSVFHGMGGYITTKRAINPVPPAAYTTAILFPFLNVFPGWSFTFTFLTTSIILIVLILFMLPVHKRLHGRVPRLYLITAAAIFALGIATTTPHTGMSFMDILRHAESRFALIAITGLSLILGTGLHVLIRSSRAYRITLTVILIWGLLAAWRTDVQIQAWRDAGLTTHHIISKTLSIAPDPPKNSRMFFFDIPRGNDQFAYIFGIGLKEAILRNYPGRNDITIIPKSQGRDLRRVNPNRDYVLGYNKKKGELERLFPSQGKNE